jgi:predicted GNAT family acetyltransferase
MEIKIHKSADKLNPYFEWLNELYNKDSGFDFFISDKKKAVEFCIRNSFTISFIEITENNKLIAHVALILNNQLPKEEAFFGFFECINNKEVFQSLWKNLISLAKKNGVKKLLGPVDGAIWFQYRINSMFSNEERFPSEPISQKHYPELLKTVNPINEVLYHSAFRKKFDAIIQITERSYNKAINQGFEIKLIENLNDNLLKDIYNLSLDLFKQNWGYTPISYNDFISLYDNKKFSNFINSIYTVTKDNMLIGYCVNMHFNKSLIIKTIGISNEFQGQGIGNALVYKVHSDAVKSGKIHKVIYALIKKENKVKHFPTDDIQIFREYSSFEYNI